MIALIKGKSRNDRPSRPNLKRRYVFVAIAFGLMSAGGFAIAYFAGFWIPNRPSAAAFPVRGIDVSGHQGPIKWNTVPRDEVHFVYIKATEGGDFRDARFTENWKSSADAGFRRGAYHFFTMKTPGRQQAANFISAVPNEPNALPPAIDLEFWGNSSERPSVGDFQRELAVFISAVRLFYGREPVFYMDLDFKNRYLRDFPAPRLWIRSVFTAPRLPKGENWMFWQFSEKIHVRGIVGFVDHNVFNGQQKNFEIFSNERF